MELRQVRYFLALSKTLNFTRAAEMVNVTQPTLTLAIKKLEEELGGPLIHRERKRTHLTHLGQMVLPFLEQVYESSAAAQMLAEDLNRGDRVPLNLGVSDVFDKDKLVNPIRELRMHVMGLELNIEGGSDATLFAELQAGALDLVVLDVVAVNEDYAKFDAIYEETMSVLAPTNSKLDKLGEPKKTDLFNEHFIGLTGSDVHDRFASAARLSNPQWTHQHRAARPTEAQIMAVSGIGIVLAGSCEPILPGLSRHTLSDLHLKRTVGIATPRGRGANNAAFMLARLLRSQAYPKDVAA